MTYYTRLLVEDLVYQIAICPQKSIILEAGLNYMVNTLLSRYNLDHPLNCAIIL